jgi:TolB-like protein/DNA-binding winged helix-turn-helix (wHTH) protein
VGDDFRVAAWLIEPRLNTVSRNGVRVHLEPKVMEVLVCLAQHVGEPVPKEELLQAVWPDTFVTDDVLKRSISELRRVFEDDAHESRIIQTIPKRGYRLIVPVEPINGKQSASPVQMSPAPSRSLRKWLVLALVSGLATLMLIVLTFGRHSLRFGKSTSPQIRSIAVLPLENLSGDPAQEYLSDGMTDALITDLAQMRSLKVISRTSSTQYKKAKKSLPEIARELSVEGVIEGTVQRSGDRVRVTAQLVEGGSDRHLWASSYERDLRDVFALEREVAADIARQVQGQLPAPTQWHLPQPQATNPGALEAYLRGSYHLNRYGKGSGEQERRKASEYFQLAIDADPNFVLAYIGMAKAHDDVLVGSREDWEIRRKAAEKALALDPNSSEALGILANLRWEKDFDWSGAEQEYRQAIALDPNNAKVRDDFCTLLAEMGRLEEAWRECQIAQELDPGNAHLPFILYWRGEYDRAIAMLRTMIERHPDDGGMHFLLFQCYTQKASHKDSMEELAKTLTLYGLTEAADKIQRAFEMSGYRAALQELANELERLQATRKFFAPVNLADIYAILGERDRAFFWLEQAYTYREQVSTGEPVDYVMVDPMLDPLRSDPRFKSLRRRIGLP